MATTDKYRFSPGNRAGNSFIYTQRGIYDCPPGSPVITAACRRLDKFEQESARIGAYVAPRAGGNAVVGRRPASRRGAVGAQRGPRRASRSRAGITRGRRNRRTF
jgi:hypothetical protein